MVDRGLGHATVDVTGVKKGIQCPFYWAFLVKCKLFKDYMYEEVKIIYWKWWIGTWEMQLLTSLVWNLGCTRMGQGRHWPRDNVRQHSQVPPPTCCWKQACQLGGPTTVNIAFHWFEVIFLSEYFELILDIPFFVMKYSKLKLRLPLTSWQCQ